MKGEAMNDDEKDKNRERGWRVYVNEGVEKKIDEMRKWIENKVEGVYIIVGGDFNARMGKEERKIREEEEEEEKSGKRSKDKKVNAEERNLLKRMEELEQYGQYGMGM